MIVSTLNLEQKYRDLLAQEFPSMPIRHVQLCELSEDDLAQVQTVMTYGYDMTPAETKKMKRLQWLHVAQSGMDPLPLDLLQEKGVYITNSRGINSSIISEHVLCAMLNIVRKTFVLAERARQKIWAPDIEVEELSLKTVSIFGVGNIGRQVAKRAKAFGMRVLGVDNHTDGVPFVDQMFRPHHREEVLAQSDFVVLCLPLLPSTVNTISRQEFDELPPTAWIINVGRGPLVNANALIEAIDAGKIGGAVLDVFEIEPLPTDDKLWTRENIWITPHTAGDHFAQYAPRMVDIIRYNMAQYPHFEQMQNHVHYDQYSQW
jgi:phosphoglycerate dehydrogenase-like enzyme